MCTLPCFSSIDLLSTIPGARVTCYKIQVHVFQGFFCTRAFLMCAALTRASPPLPPPSLQIIPGARKMGYKIQAHAFQGYWEDIGTIEAFYNANLALANPDKNDFRWGGGVALVACSGGDGWGRHGSPRA